MEGTRRAVKKSRKSITNVVSTGRGITWPFIKSKEQQDQSAKTVQDRNWSVFTNEVDLGKKM